MPIFSSTSDNSKWVSIWPLLFMTLSLWGPSAFAGCFKTHVEEAITINETRADIYFDVSETDADKDRSLHVSSSLILLEKLLLPVAWFFDLQSRPYEKAGVNFFCDVFVDIALTPELVPHSFASLAQPIPLDAVLDEGPFLKEVKYFAKQEKYEELRELLAVKVNDLKTNYPNHYCLYRHFLESMGRISALAPGAIAESRRLGLKDPRWSIRQLFNLHRFGLAQARYIDQQAIPLQNKGTPILCNDLPHIPF